MPIKEERKILSLFLSRSLSASLSLPLLPISRLLCGNKNKLGKPRIRLTYLVPTIYQEQNLGTVVFVG
jgi:hypothetical protein